MELHVYIMSFQPCSSGCSFHISPFVWHEFCIQCLGRAHAKSVLVDGLCHSYEDLSIGMLRSQLGFFARRPKSPQSLPVPVLLLPGMRRQQCVPEKSLVRQEWLGLLLLPTLYVLWLSLKDCLWVSQISYLGLVKKMGCQSQHQRCLGCQVLVRGRC